MVFVLLANIPDRPRAAGLSPPKSFLPAPNQQEIAMEAGPQAAGAQLKVLKAMSREAGIRGEMPSRVRVARIQGQRKRDNR